MKSNLFPIAKEGWRYILGAVIALFVFGVLNFEILQVLSLVSLIFFVYIFRNPERELPRFEPQSVLSPVDGRVISIDTIQDEKYSFKVKIDSSYSDVGVLRSPVNAMTVASKKLNGARLASTSPLFEDINENVCIVFENDDGNKVEVHHRLKQSFCPLSLDILRYKTLVQSQRYGYMTNGMTEIYLPHNFRLDIKLGEELHASETLIGYFS